MEVARELWEWHHRSRDASNCRWLGTIAQPSGEENMYSNRRPADRFYQQKDCRCASPTMQKWQHMCTHMQMRYFGLVVRISRWAQYIILHTRHKKVLPFAFLVHLSVIYATHTHRSIVWVHRSPSLHGVSQSKSIANS